MLTVERKDQGNETPLVPMEGGGVAMITPPIDEDYWAYRVDVGGGQAIVGFPKYSTIGVGFAVEEDWNTNLPYRCSTDAIWNHIKHNRGPATATDDEIKAAIELLCNAVVEDRPGQARDLR